MRRYSAEWEKKENRRLDRFEEALRKKSRRRDASKFIQKPIKGR